MSMPSTQKAENELAAIENLAGKPMLVRFSFASSAARFAAYKASETNREKPVLVAKMWLFRIKTYAVIGDKIRFPYESNQTLGEGIFCPQPIPG